MVIVEPRVARGQGVVVAAQETQLINKLVATGKPVCQREVEVKRKVKNLSQG